MGHIPQIDKYSDWPGCPLSTPIAMLEPILTIKIYLETDGTLSKGTQCRLEAPDKLGLFDKTIDNIDKIIERHNQA